MKSFLKLNIKYKISLASLLAFLAFIGVQLLSNKSIENLKASEKEMLNSSLLSKRIGTILSSINAYESKMTGFVLTGNDKFLFGNEEDLRQVSVNLQDIKNISTSVQQNKLVLELDSLVQAEINFCQQALIAYDKTNTNAEIALINTGEGKQLINEITNASNSILQLEENNLARIISNNDSFSRKVAYLDYAATVFALTVILFSIFILFRDINKRIKVERQLRIEQEKAEQSAIMKEQFMANMSHEIRTPMNAIIGFTNMLSKSKLDDKQKKHISAIQSSGENLLTIINDILDFSKIEAGMVSIEKIPFSPSELLDSVNTMFLPKAHDKKLQLNFYTSPALPKIIMGDPSRLTQILVNLISNALKFTSEGNISVKTELLREEHENLLVQFTVKDTGIGIPKEKLNEIFERFTQANADTNRKYGGSGLGLSITKKLIELQRGTIHVESAQGVGSSFKFIIPYKKTTKPVRPQNKQRPHPALNSKINILVAEDNPLNQYLINSLLTEWGFGFDMVENGKLAIEKLIKNKERAYDLVLMDIQMPEMNGYDTAHYIRQNLNLHLPIIAMTAHVLPGEKDKCLSYGMTDYIAKPIRDNELYDLIAKYIHDIPGKTKPEINLRSTKTNENQVTDLEYVKELSNGIPGFVDKMIGLFLLENPLEIQRLETAIHQRDFNTIQSTAHKIKSTISFAGLDSKIKNDLNEMEELALKKDNLPEIEMLFSKVKEVCLKAIEELKDLKTNAG